MINVSSSHVLSAKEIHVNAMEKEVKKQLNKYKEIFRYLKDYKKDKSLTYSADKRNNVKAVINLSNGKTNISSDIDNQLKCILYEYRKNAVKILEILNKIEPDIRNILQADRNELITLIGTHNHSITGLIDKKLNRIFKKIFNYEAFSAKSKTKYNGYTLTKNLKIIACPYCNRMYTLTVICKPKTKTQDERFITRPELDHYFPKSKYPLFALSFYNLIPSCHICNNIKSDNADHTMMHHHPYLDDTKLEISLDGIKYDDKSKKFNDYNEWDIVLDENGCDYTKNSIEVFHLAEVYGAHSQIIEDMIERAQEYNQTFIDNIKSLFQGIENPHNIAETIDIEFEKEELLERIFGVMPPEQDKSIPMNKFKRGMYKSIRAAQNISTNVD